MMKYKNNTNIKAGLFLLPSLSGCALFFILPFIGGFYYALIDKPVGGVFTGLNNFVKLLSNKAFLNAASNTITFTIACVPLIILSSLALAMLLYKAPYANNTFRMFYISPMVVPVASVAFFWQILFDYSGTFNYLLDICNIEAVDWMNTFWAKYIIVIIYLWKNTGYNVVLFLAGLHNIPKEFYEAVRIEGAGAFQTFFRITAVYLTPTTFFVFIISVINSFKVFREAYLMLGEYPHESAYMLQHFMNNMFTSLDYQKLTSSAYMMAAVMIILVYILFTFERRLASNLTH